MTEEFDSEPQIIVRTLLPAAPRDGGLLHVLIQLEAPPRPEHLVSAHITHRPPLRLALVLDCSANMAGQALNDAIECIEHIVRGMEPTDQVALVLCRGEVEVPVPLQDTKKTVYDDFDAATWRLQGVGEASVIDGWLEGARQLAQGDSATISRIVIFSDGRALAGQAVSAGIEEWCAKALAKGISTSTVGFADSGSHELMRRMARSGAGQHYSGYGVGDLCKGFDQEFGLFNLLCWDSIEVRITLLEDLLSVAPAPVHARGHSLLYHLPYLYFGFTSSLLLELQVKPSDKELRSLFTLRVRGTCERHNCMHVTGGFVPELENVDAATWATLPQDGVVAQMLLEGSGQ